MEVKDNGILIASKKFDLHKYIVEVFCKMGRWKGFYSPTKSNPPMTASEGVFVWKGRSASSFGKLSFEINIPSKTILFWNNPIVIAAISSICACAKKFIPEKVDCFLDYKIFKSCITEINENNYLEKLLEWEFHILREFLDFENAKNLFDNPEKPIYKQETNFKSNKLFEYWAKTSNISTKEREDFIAIFRSKILEK